MSPSAFASDVPAELLLDYARSIGWRLYGRALGDCTDRERGQRFSDAIDKLERNLKDRVFRELEACERVAKGGFRAVLLPACADDAGLRQILLTLPSDRARALRLFLHNKPADQPSLAFERAEALYDCGAHHLRGRTWRAYELKSMRRDWHLPDKARSSLDRIAKSVLADLGETARQVEIDLFARPAGEGPTAQDDCHTFLFHISDAEASEDVWSDGQRVVHRKVPNRHILFCVTPVNKMIECGSEAVDTELCDALLKAIATRFLKERGKLEEVTALPVRLTGLGSRRTWPTLPEHQILSVEVKKLVVRRGRGTCTYFVPARKAGDAYDVAPPRINAASIIAAGLRVTFDEGMFGNKKSFVQFEVSLPNRCTLRESREADRFILETYLEEWGLRRTNDPEADHPLTLKPDAGPLAQIIGFSSAPIETSFLVEVLGDGIKTLCGVQALVPDLAPESLTCLLCPSAHPVDALPSAEGTIGICPDAGTFKIDDAAPPTMTLDMDALAVQLTLALRLETAALKVLLPEKLYYLGQCGGAPAWTAFFAPSLEDSAVIEEVTARLRNYSSHERGIILTSSQVPSALQFPGKHAPVLIDNIITLASGRMLCEDNAIKSALSRKSLGKRQPGPKTAKDEAIRIAKLRARIPVRAASPEREIAAIKATVLQTQPDAKFPDDKTIHYTWLPDYFRNWSIPESPKKKTKKTG